jgi:hypothetical protein
MARFPAPPFLQRCVAVAFIVAGCAGGTAPASRAPVPASTSTAGEERVATRTAPVQKPPGPTTAPEETDTCHWASELGAAFDALHPDTSREAWIASARAHLLPRDVAERSLTGIAQAVVSALAYKRYSKLAAFVGPKGLCLRAAKGAPCETLTAAEIAACGLPGSRKRAWPVDDGADAAPQLTCAGALSKVFYARDFLRKAQVQYNCFPAPGRGNNGGPVISSPPALGYVDLHDPGDGESQGSWRSLWLVFDGDPAAPELVEMMAEYSRI